MITALLGRPGAGKSYEAVVFQIIPAAKEGRLVVTNIPINLDAVEKYYGAETAAHIRIVKTEYGDYGLKRPFSEPDDFLVHKDWQNAKGQGPLFVVDETHLCIGRDAKKEVLEYLSMHRHYGHDIIVMSQSPTKLHKDLRDMIEVSYRCVKKSVFGDDTHYIKKTYHGCAVRNTEFVHEEEREYKAQYFQFYKSHTQSGSSVFEASAKDVKAVLNPYKKLSLAMMLIGALAAIFLFKSMMFPANAKSETQIAAPGQDIVSNSPQSQSAQAAFSAPAAKAIQKPLFEDKRHPFYKLVLHVEGSATYYDGKYLVKQVWFSASQNGQFITRLNLGDLKLAGYDVTVLTDCAVRVEYGDYSDWITCDSPVIAAAPVGSDAISGDGAEG